MTVTPICRVIPVVDLRGGAVVHAVRGQRATYRPVESRLVRGSAPLTVARALLRVTGSAVLYVADLDAIEGGQAQCDTLAALLDGLPGVTLWLDAGFADTAAAHALQRRLGVAHGRWRAVYGSESLRDRRALHAVARDGTAVLSLDLRGGRALDPAGCWQHPALWPRDVIVMTLDRVGAGTGPDLATLGAAQALAPGRRWYGAGGVRAPSDLHACAAAGADGWLVASALHDGRWEMHDG